MNRPEDIWKELAAPEENFSRATLERFLAAARARRRRRLLSRASVTILVIGAITLVGLQLIPPRDPAAVAAIRAPETSLHSEQLSDKQLLEKFADQGATLVTRADGTQRLVLVRTLNGEGSITIMP